MSSSALHTPRHRLSPRFDAYRSTQTGEIGVLQELNSRAQSIAVPVDDGDLAPVIFVAGSPRSGTTVLAQTICQCFDLAYIDNLAARFWLAPAVGLQLSHSSFGTRRELNGRSDFGRTTGLDIHGFHYFWIHHLRLDYVDDLFEPPLQRGVNVREIERHLRELLSVAKRPLLMKGYYPAYFMELFAKLRVPVMFVMTRRDVEAQALSIHEARLAETGSPDTWWSMPPPDYYELLGQPWPTQIVGQIAGLTALFERQLRSENVRHFFVDYDRLCAEPAATMEDFAAWVLKTSGHRLVSKGGAPMMQRRDGSRHSVAARRLIGAALSRQ